MPRLGRTAREIEELEVGGLDEDELKGDTVGQVDSLEGRARYDG